MIKIVNFVHAIDTEGPLYESVEAKFNRIEDLFGINNIEISEENLHKMQKGLIDLQGNEKQVMKILNGHLTFRLNSIVFLSVMY